MLLLIFKICFSLECEILEKLLKAFVDLQNMQFLPTLALIYGATTRLTVWESTLNLQNREVSDINGYFLKKILRQKFFCRNNNAVPVSLIPLHKSSSL